MELSEEQRKKLLKRFFYVPLKEKSNNYNFIYLDKKKGIGNFEELNELCDKIKNGKKQLSKIKTSSIRSMIINQNNIPQKWVQKQNYKVILNRAINSPHLVDYAKNYLDHKNINKKKEDHIILNEITQVKKPEFLTIDNQHRVQRDRNSASLRIKYGYKIKKKFGKSFNRILSYQGLNTDAINDNYKNDIIVPNGTIENNNLKKELIRIPTDFNKNNNRTIDTNHYHEILNFNSKSLKKNFNSINNMSIGLRDRLILPKIKAN